MTGEGYTPERIDTKENIAFRESRGSQDKDCRQHQCNGQAPSARSSGIAEITETRFQRRKGPITPPALGIADERSYNLWVETRSRSNRQMDPGTYFMALTPLLLASSQEVTAKFSVIMVCPNYPLVHIHHYFPTVGLNYPLVHAHHASLRGVGRHACRRLSRSCRSCSNPYARRMCTTRIPVYTYIIL